MEGQKKKTREAPKEKGERESDILGMGRKQRAAAKRAWARWKEKASPTESPAKKGFLKVAEMLGVDPKYAVLGRELLEADLSMIQMNAVLAVLAADQEGEDFGNEPEAIKQLGKVLPRETIPMLKDALREGDVEKFRDALALL